LSQALHACDDSWRESKRSTDWATLSEGEVLFAAIVAPQNISNAGKISALAAISLADDRSLRLIDIVAHPGISIAS
jgi:hypothetical protein